MAGAAAPFNGDYRLLAESLLTSIGANIATVPAPPDATTKYGGGRMDVERTESRMTKWLSDICADTNATVLQNVCLFMDHISNVYKAKIAMYETRGDMERLPPGSANPNAFSETVTRLCKEYNDAHPNGQAQGGDVRSARFEYLPEKVAPCARAARRHHGTKTSFSERAWWPFFHCGAAAGRPGGREHFSRLGSSRTIPGWCSNHRNNKLQADSAPGGSERRGAGRSGPLRPA